MTQEYIEIKGARENNLKNVSLKIPKRKITIFTGVSGSGKSSLVFDTIAMEAQRLLAENFSTFLRGFMPRYPQPAADSLANLNMAVVIDQKRLGGGSHSTVGTITDMYSLLRLLFSRAGTPSIGGAHLFSFNDPNGMCPECNGLGRQMGANMDLFLDESKSLNEGAILFPEYAPQTWGWNILHESHLFDMDKKIADYTKEEKDLLLYGKAQKVSLKIGARTVNLTYEGVTKKFITKYIKRDVKSMSERTQKAVEPYISMGPCHLCKGARLSPEALSVKVDGYTIAELSAMEVDELVGSHPRSFGAPRQTHSQGAGKRADAPVRYWPGIPEPEPGDRQSLGRRVGTRKNGEAFDFKPGRRDVHFRRAECRASSPGRPPAERAASKAA